MTPHRNEPSGAKDEIAGSSDSADTNQQTSAATAPGPAVVPASNAAPGPLPSTWATSTTTSTATTTSRGQSSNSNKKTSKARVSREPVFPAMPPKGLDRQDTTDYANLYANREAVNDRVYKHPYSARSQRSRYASDLHILEEWAAEGKPIKGKRVAQEGKERRAAKWARRQAKEKPKKKQPKSKMAVVEEEDEDVEMEDEGDVDAGDDTFVQPADHRPAPPTGRKDDDDDDEEPGMGGGKGGLMGAGQAIMA